MNPEFLGDTEDNRFHITQFRHTDKPLAVWCYDKDGTGVDYFGVVHHNGMAAASVGYIGVKIDERTADADNYTVHVYADTYIDKLTLTKETHHSISKDAYVKELLVTQEAVVHIEGHIAELTVKDGGQAILQAGAYVDRLLVMSDGYLRAENDASIFYGSIQPGGSCMIASGAHYKELTGQYGVFVQPYPEDVLQVLQVRMCIKSRPALVRIAKELTERYQSTGCLKFGYAELYKIQNCVVLNDGQAAKGSNLVLSFTADIVICREQLRAAIMERYKEDIHWLELEQYGQKL